MSLFPSSSIPHLDNTLGAWLLGTFFGTLLQGTVYHQAYRYSRLYPNDPAYLKTWVYYIFHFNHTNAHGPDHSFHLQVVVVVLLETLNTALTWHSSYVYLIKNFANPIALLSAPVCLRVHNLPAALKFSWMASTGSCIMMAGDFLVTFVLIYALQKSRTGIRRTDSLLDLLIVYAVSTGFVICVFNALNVAFAFAFPNNLIYSAFSIILTKLYANTLLVALNTRKSLVSRGILGDNETSPFMSTVARRQKASAVVIAHRNTSEITSTAMQTQSTAIELKMVSENSDPSQLALDRDGSVDESKFDSVRRLDMAATV
ncbi:hypothetical protein BN946_scf184989.g55 [Trametes cinnabarina]|uniref:DUF6534 domain-containing protein n=1 Tax=Pycnoporus cinnabarinus TaxID=5643 RepID=A0A060S972_PYCCI|nr:hypothetical protein BN946_scf184989.g55 [Trametes cinnabarina]